MEQAVPPVIVSFWDYKNPEVTSMQTAAVAGKGEDLFISWEPCSELRD